MSSLWAKSANTPSGSHTIARKKHFNRGQVGTDLKVRRSSIPAACRKLTSIKVYQYTFRMPNDDRGKDPHAVMWDYNVGLVRITSFIKSLGHSKVISLSRTAI